jgi:phosphoinositide-3-kinase regulatory subunit 4
MAASLRTDGRVPIADPEVEPGADAVANFESVFDNAGHQLFLILESHTKQLVEDSDVHVRRAFLASVPELCMFFQEHSNDILLTHLNTYLNDRDWMLKCAFFDTIVGIATFIGSTSLEEFMLPLMIQALTDTEEFVVQAAIHSLAQLADLGLLSRTKVWELVDLISRFTMHPNIWIREAAAECLSKSANFLELADERCILMPIVKPYLKVDYLTDFSELNILDTLKRPISRAVFDQAITWALKSDRGVFWKSLQQMRSLTFGSSGSSAATATNHSGLNKISRNDEDEQWLGKLKNLGLKAEDEIKLLGLREFIWRLSKMRSRDSSTTGDMTIPTGLISLKSLGITPQTVFFNDTPALEQPSAGPDLDAQSGPYTLADALLDASMTIDDSMGKRKRAALNTHKNRVHSVGPRSPQSSGRLLSPIGVGRASSMDSRGVTLVARSGGGSESTSPQDGPYSSRRAIRHQSSALNLLDRRDSNKSVPEIGTTDTTAFGEVEGPFAQDQQTELDAGQDGATAGGNKISKHSYEGTDPNIHKMLDKMSLEHFPRDVKDFGPFVQPIARTKASRMSAQPREDPWKPQGRLISTFGEHKGPINRVAVSPDHVFFVTGGQDGTVKVWDTARLERNITHRSRQTHKHAEGARVVALGFVENTHCFVSCATDGSVHIVKVDTVFAGGVIRYGKLRLMREHQLPDGEFAVWCEHFKQESVSTLLLATNRSRIIAIDLKFMNVLYVLENPIHHGTPTCFCVDKKRNWLCVGTSHGVVDLWDLRFKMRLRGWGVPGKASIYRICIHPTKGRGKWVCISGGTALGEVTVWDLEKTVCREIYRTGGSKDGPSGYEAWDVDEDKPEGMLGRFATDLESSETANVDRGVRAVVVGTEAAQDSRDVRHAFLLTGGSDKRLRFWDMSRVESSTIFSGLQSDEPRPFYTATNPMTGLTVNTEKFPRPSLAPTSGSSKGRSTTSNVRRRPRSTVISSQQQQVLQSHMDSILDIALIEHPYTMSVSVDRSGVVFIFQ